MVLKILTRPKQPLGRNNNMEEEIINIIGTLGFPIAMCLYMVWERNKTMKKLIKVVHDLSLVIKTKMK